MRALIRFALLPLALCLPTPSFSQTTSQSTAQTPTPAAAAAPSGAPADGRVAEWIYGERVPAVPGLPFSAKAELETVNQLQNGSLITHKTYNLIARDRQGRTHNEARNWIDLTTGAEPRLTRIEYEPLPTYQNRAPPSFRDPSFFALWFPPPARSLTLWPWGDLGTD